jgi:hypothetical protein
MWINVNLLLETVDIDHIDGEGAGSWVTDFEFKFRTVQLRRTLWHIDPFLGNDRKISDYTTAVAK